MPDKILHCEHCMSEDYMFNQVNASIWYSVLNENSIYMPENFVQKQHKCTVAATAAVY